MAVAVKTERRNTTLLALIIAGEAVFFLPFVMAMISYLFGGILADRYPVRNLVAAALWIRAIVAILAGYTEDRLNHTRGILDINTFFLSCPVLLLQG